MAGRDPQPRNHCLTDKGAALLSETDVAWKIACLLRLDWGSAQGGTHGADVSNQIVALGLVALNLIGGFGEGDC